MQIDVDGTMIRTFQSRLNVTVFDPGKQIGCDEDIVDTGAVVCLTGRDLGVPAYAPQVVLNE